MAYELLIMHGRVIDGSGLPSFRGDMMGVSWAIAARSTGSAFTPICSAAGRRQHGI